MTIGKGLVTGNLDKIICNEIDVCQIDLSPIFPLGGNVSLGKITSVLVQTWTHTRWDYTMDVALKLAISTQTSIFIQISLVFSRYTIHSVLCHDIWAILYLLEIARFSLPLISFSLSSSTALLRYNWQTINCMYLNYEILYLDMHTPVKPSPQSRMNISITTKSYL